MIVKMMMTALIAGMGLMSTRLLLGKELKISGQRRKVKEYFKGSSQIL